MSLRYVNQGRLAAAEALCENTLRLSKENYAADHPGTLRTASNLAVFIDHQGRLDEARAIYEQYLADYKHRYGINHVLTIRIRGNLAGILRMQGKFERAKFAIKEVLSELMRLLGPDNFHVSIAQYGLAEILRESGNLEEAQERYSLAMAVMEHVSPEQPLLFRVIDGLGIVYQESGNLPQLDSSSKRAWNSNMKALG